MKKGLKEEKKDTSHCQGSNQKSGLNKFLFDLDVPKVVRKGDRSCTKHPISKFMTYDHLSAFVRALVTNLAGVETP